MTQPNCFESYGIRHRIKVETGRGRSDDMKNIEFYTENPLCFLTIHLKVEDPALKTVYIS